MPQNKGKFTLDDLLKAKREERPDDAFWNRFDRELKTKQSRLLQKQILESTDSRSPFAKIMYRTVFATGTLGIAAFAVMLNLDTGTQQPAQPTQQKIGNAPVPSFTVKQDLPAQPSSGLREFSSVASSVQPRVQVVSYLSDPVEQPALAQQSQPITANRTPSRNSSVDALLANDYGFTFAAESGIIDSGEYAFEAAASETARELSAFERNYLLGKYADPLGGDFAREFESGAAAVSRSMSTQTVSILDIDRLLSNQGGRSSRSIDALTVRF